MDAARLQEKVYSGYAKSAQRIGYAFTIYRPNGATNPVVGGNVVGSPINAAFTPRGSGGSSGFNFSLTSDYIKPLFHGLFDGTGVNVGDYLVNADHGTYFVIAKPDLAPILCVQCNNTVSLSRATESSSPGVQTYIGATTSTISPVMTSFPASVIYDARGKNTGAQLPMDDVNPYFNVLIPAISGVDVRSSDIFVDADQRRYTVTASEHSPLGWRIVGRQNTT